MGLTTATPTGVATYLFRPHVDEHHLLLLRRAAPRFFGLWFPAVGFVSPGESVEDAAVRDIREETGLEPERLYREQPEPVMSEVGLLIQIFVVYVRAGCSVQLNHEHSEYEWVAPATALKRLSLVEQREALERIRTRFLLDSPPEELRVYGSGGSSNKAHH